MAYFLDGPLVVVMIFFLPFKCDVSREALCISKIFLFRRARNASLSLSILEACNET